MENELISELHMIFIAANEMENNKNNSFNFHLI